MKSANQYKARRRDDRTRSFSEFLFLHTEPTPQVCEVAACTVANSVAVKLGDQLALPRHINRAYSFLSEPQAAPLGVALSEFHPASFAEAAQGGAKAAGSGHPTMMDIAGLIVFLGISGLVGTGYKKALMKRKSQDNGKPSSVSVNDARNVPLSVSQLTNESLMILAEQGVTSACCERLVRHIMAVDNCSYADARQTMLLIDAKAAYQIDGAFWPYTLAIGTCAVSGILSIPMVYDKHFAELTNYLFVHSERPEPKDMTTMWQVSGWAWEWMEPLLGTAAFSILCVQLARGLTQDLEIPVFHQRVRLRVGNQLQREYARYDPDIVMQFVKTLNMAGEETLDD